MNKGATADSISKGINVIGLTDHLTTESQDFSPRPPYILTAILEIAFLLTLVT